MGRLSAFLLTGLLVVALAGCGSSKPGSGAPSPTVQALSYFPTTSPFVLTVATNPKATAIKQLQQSSPSYAFAATAVFAQLSKLGIDYNQDIRPLFGNPVAAGVVSASGFTGSGDSQFLVVWVTKSADKLKSLLGKLHLSTSGSHDGATLYRAGSGALATAGPTVILARSPAILNAALDRHAHNQGFDTAAYAKASTGISTAGVITAFGDLTSVLSTPKAAQARSVPWVGAITGYGASVTATQGAVAIRYHVATTGKPLTVTQLPIASGPSAPGIAGDLPVGVGIRDPEQIIDFFVDAVRRSDPAQYAKYQRQAASLKRHSGVDITSLAKMLTGDLNVESDTRTTIARAQVSDPAAARSMLAGLVKAKAAKGARVTALGGGLYAVRSHTTTLTVGVIGGQLVVGRATPAQLRAFAEPPAGTASGGAGSVNFRIALPDLLRLTLKHAPSPMAQQLLGMLGVITGSAQADTDGLSGTVTIPVK
ncbi:MAG: DUF3352 domain-containing protein [Solirubrobacteraceae bacterium]